MNRHKTTRAHTQFVIIITSLFFIIFLTFSTFNIDLIGPVRNHEHLFIFQKTSILLLQYDHKRWLCWYIASYSISDTFVYTMLVALSMCFRVGAGIVGGSCEVPVIAIFLAPRWVCR